jgi:PleD family two-component response regulator
MLVGIPGGEPLIEAARALGPRRPIVIAASTASAPEAVRRAVQIGADLATARPHDAERLAPVLFAASRLVERPRPAHGAAVAALIEETEGVIEETHGVTDRAIDDMLDELSDLEPAGFVPLAAFDQRAAAELERAGRYGYPLAVALCSLENTEPPPELRGLLRARAGNALVHAVRDIDLATELGDDRFLVLMPYTDRALAAEVARRVLAAVADGDPVVAAGRSFPLRLVGAVAATRPADRRGFPQLVHDVTQLLEQALATGASLAVET